MPQFDPLRFRRFRRWSLKWHPLIGLEAEGRSVNMKRLSQGLRYVIRRRLHGAKVRLFPFCPYIGVLKATAAIHFITMQNAPKVTLLDGTIAFPPIEEAWEGLLAIGGDLTEARLIAAYEHGVFPWYGENDPILWWAPEERSVLFLDSLHIAKSMRSVLNSNRFELKIDTAFERVIQACADVRSATEGTWISQDIIEAYIRLHDLGLAHSFEAWREGELVGGLYGVSIGCMFFGESMFSLESNASKFCFIQLVEWAKANGYGPIDCQISNAHLLSLGAEIIPREAYTKLLRTYLAAGKTRRGKWTIHK